MALFQNTVASKYLNTQDPELLSEKWEEFSSHFHDPVIQENIRNSKEEQYQEGFLRDLFVKVLGYTLNPTPEFNLTTEYKNVKDAKKADGAVIIGEDVPAVIELKGTDTTDLGTVEDQAFGYKNNQPTCKYVVISNFEKLRFYIDNAIEHIEFNLFNLTKEEFNLLYLCLAWENIKNDTASKIKNESLSKEDEITKQLYKDYSVFKRELFQNLIEQNPNYNQVELFKKSQKLLDRFLFLFFGEDRGLLPPNSVRMILDQWSKLKDLDAYTPLYERFKKYFGYLNTGFEGKHYDVFAYNGGLFKPDEILDNTKIDDDLLYTHTLRLSEYDFESEVDVNILGHIFEHSLNEIDEIKAQLAGEAIDKTQTKRKKDGVFYTPKYITKYIVENTVGKLCEEEKTKLGIKEEDYYTDKKRQLKTKQKLLKKLQDYRKWLHEITIIDPACGSGSFLIEALNFLIEEHSYIDEMEAKLTDSAIAFSYHPESILENNLYGVDINEESVEIAKLSLWLRTAEPNRKLSSLSHNLKCGNSLIDDPEVAGDLAFNWEKEFPKVFAKGGFDVVIGNPPYVRNELIIKQEKDFLQKSYLTFTGKSDLYVYFFEKSYEILKESGICGLIASSKYTKTKYGKSLIDFLNKNTVIDLFIDFKDLDVFEGIIAYPSIIIFKRFSDSNNQSKLLIVTNENYKEVENKFLNFELVKQVDLFDLLGSWTNSKSSKELFYLFKKLKSENNQLIEVIDKPQVGIKTGLNKVYIFKSEDLPQCLSESLLVKKYILGREVKRFSYVKHDNSILLPYTFTKDNEELILIDIENNFSKELDYLSPFKEKLSNRAIIKDGLPTKTKKWYELQQIKTDFPYHNEFIVYPDISLQANFTLVSNCFYDMTCFGIPSNSKSLLGILNSKLINKYLESICVKARGGYLRLKSQYVNTIPIKETMLHDVELENIVEKMLALNKDLQELSNRFQRMLEREFELDDLSKKLQDWHHLTFNDFLKELKKKKVNLSLSQKAEWEDYFLKEQAKALSIQSEIDATDKEIDQMVYQYPSVQLHL